MTYSNNKQAQLFETKEYADCTFIFPATKVKIPSHKFLLMLNSPVFERMLFGDLARAEIVIEDIDAVIFDKFLKYIYTGLIQVESISEAWKLVYVSQKYFLPDLKNQCITYVTANLCLGNLLMCYEYASLYGHDKLAQDCLNDIWYFGKGILLSGSDYHPQLATLRTIAQNESVEVALMIVHWALVVCSERDVNTTSVNVAEILKEHKIALCKHYVDARLYTALDAELQQVVEVYNELTANLIQPAIVCKRQQRFRFKLRAEYKNAYRLPLRGTSETITSRICCARDCLLFGVCVATKSRPEHVSQEDYLGGVTVYVYVKDNDTLANLLFKQSATFACLKFDDVQNIIFDVPVLCKAYVSYMICVEYTAESNRESVLLTYMTDKLTSGGHKSKPVICFGDEPNGSIVKGLSYYQV